MAIMDLLKKLWDFDNAIKLGGQIAFGICTFLFTFMSDEFIGEILKGGPINWLPLSGNIVLFKVIVLALVFILAYIYYHCRKSVLLDGKYYDIEIQYDDLFRIPKGRILIPFDECYTTTVDDTPEGINPHSICGQFLEKHPMLDVQELIRKTNLEPYEQPSKFQNQTRYESGRVIPYQNFFLMAFAKLDEKGLARMSLEDYLQSLWILWKELDTYYGQEDVYIPILGSGVTRFTDQPLNQQELLDIIIESYKLAPYKIKRPNKLHIVCRKQEGFSLNKIGHSI